MTDNTVPHEAEPAEDRITVRLCTQFPDDIPGQHDCVEMICVYSGHATCPAGGKSLRLCAGELLLLGPGPHRDVCRPDSDCVAASFFIPPALFGQLPPLLGDSDSPLRLFFTDALFSQSSGAGFLCFHTSGNTRVRNLTENLLLALLSPSAGSRKISEMTLSVLYLELSEYAQNLPYKDQEHPVSQVLRYIDQNYRDGKLTDAAALFNYDICNLSREIRRQTGKTFTELIQKKRMSQAAALLRTTDLTVEDISRSVGYENVSYFHRLFRSTFGMSPRRYRVARL